MNHKGAVLNPNDKRLKANRVKAINLVKQEISVAADTVVEEIVEIKSLGSNFSSALENKLPASDYFTKHTVTVTISDKTKPVVEMDGFWDGMLLKAAMHAIEREYDRVRKVSAVNAMKRSQLNNTTN